MDINGNGKQDIISEHNSITSYFRNSADGGYAPGYEGVRNLPLFDSNDKRNASVGDFNGDGAQDILVFNGSNLTFNFWGSNGAYIVNEIPNWLNPAPDGVTASNKISTPDINGDGLSDLLITRFSTGTSCGGNRRYGGETCRSIVSSSARPYLSTGQGFVAVKDPSTGEDLVINNYRGVGDFDGDSMLDFATSGSSYTSSLSISYATAERPNLLKSIKHPTGSVTTVAYTSSAFAEDSSQTFRQPVVESISTTNGRNGADEQTRTTSYSYEGGRWNIEYRKSLGFAVVRKSLPLSDSEVANGVDRHVEERRYSQTVSSVGRLLEVKRYTEKGSTEKQLTAKKNFLTIAEDGKPFRTFVNRADNTTYYGDTALFTRVDYQYNLYGAPTVITDRRFKGLEDDTYTGIKYNVSHAPYIADRPIERRLRGGYNANAPLLRQTRFFYDAATNFNTAPTRGNLNRPGFTGDCLVLLTRLYRLCSCLHRMPPQPRRA